MKKFALIVLLLMLFICQIAWAVGKVTVDPNISASRNEAGQWDKDSRLAQKVTYSAEHKSVKLILADLSEKTGVTFNAGYNKLDWQVRDRKMNIFVKNVPLSQLMSSIARVMEFKWKINVEKAPWTYRLYMDRKTLSDANAELSKAQDEYDNEIAQRRKDFTDMMENWNDDLSQNEMDKLRTDNPYLYYLHKNGIGAAVHGLLNDVSGLKDAFISPERDMSTPISSLSPQTQQAVLNAVKMRYQRVNEGKSFPPALEKAFNTGSMWLDVLPDELGWKDMENRKFCGIGLYINNEFCQLDPLLGDPSSPMNQVYAERALQVSEKNISQQEAWIQNRSQSMNAYFEECKHIEKIFPSEPIWEHEDEPYLHNELDLNKIGERQIHGLPDLFALLADLSGFSVVSDSFKDLNNAYLNINSPKIELKEFLTKFSEGLHYNWEKQDSIMEFQSRDWFKKRMVQIPDEWVEKWHADMKKQGYLPLDDYAQIAMLTADQIKENIQTDEYFSSADMFKSSNANEITLMRIYASLDAAQRKAMFSGMGLDLAICNQQQWAQLRKMCYGSSVEPSADSLMLVCNVVTRQNEAPEYTFKLTNTLDNSEKGKWVVTMIKYQEPPKPEPQAEQKTEAKPQPTQDKKADTSAAQTKTETPAQTAK